MVRFKIGKEQQDIDYTTGVKQGENLALTLFILVIQALEEISIKHWKHTDITPTTLTFSPPNQGSLSNHKPTTPSQHQLNTHMLMYVDNCAALFNSRNDKMEGKNIRVDHEETGTHDARR